MRVVRREPGGGEEGDKRVHKSALRQVFSKTQRPLKRNARPVLQFMTWLSARRWVLQSRVVAAEEVKIIKRNIIPLPKQVAFDFIHFCLANSKQLVLVRDA